MPDNPVRVNCDAVVLRGFMTYIIRRHDGSRRQVAYLDKTLICLAHISYTTVFFLPSAKIACLRKLYELVSKYWAPKKKTSSESLESDDCEVMNGVSECPLEDGYEEVEGEELLVAEQLGVLAASSDAADLSPALKSGLTDDLSKLSLESPHVSVKRPAPSSSSKAPAKLPKHEIFEISDSPCRKTSGRPPVDPARLARVEFLK